MSLSRQTCRWEVAEQFASFSCRYRGDEDLKLHVAFICDMLLSEVYVSCSIVGSCINSICMSIRVLTGTLSAPKDF